MSDYKLMKTVLITRNVLWQVGSLLWDFNVPVTEEILW